MSWQTPASVLFGVHLQDLLQPGLDGLVRADEIGDPDATRTVYITIAVFVLLGSALVALVVWLIRRTRPEAQLLAPLETMATRGWRGQDPAAQRRTLDESRPAGARPMRREAAEPSVVSDFGDRRPVRSFDDLAEGQLTSPDEPDDHASDDADVEATESMAVVVGSEQPSSDQPNSDQTNNDQTNNDHEAAVSDPDAVLGDDTGPITQESSVEIDATIEHLRPDAVVDDARLLATQHDGLAEAPADDSDERGEPVVPGEGLLRHQRPAD